MVNPGAKPTISQYLAANLKESNGFRVDEVNLDSNQGHAKDSFGELPYELLFLVFNELSGDAIMELMTASKFVYCQLRYDAKFWQRRIRSEMQWFWELNEVVESEKMDFQRVYYFLDWMTTPTFGMRGPLIGLANRRRIWSTCQQIAYHYDIQACV